VVVVAELAGRQRLEPHVVLDVRRRHDDGIRLGVTEYAPLERGQPGFVDVLDDLHEHGRVVSGELLST